jgi:hypothetical protein
VFTYFEHKHQHFDIERLRSGNRLSVQSQPQYAQYLLRPGGGPDAALKDLQDILPSNDNRLWAGRLGEQLSSTPAATLDCTRPCSATNRPLIGINTLFDGDSFGDVVHWDNWRILTPGDLSALIVEGLRIAPTVYLAGTREPDSASPIAQAADLGCILENSFLDVRTLPGTPHVFVTEIRRRG